MSVAAIERRTLAGVEAIELLTCPEAEQAPGDPLVFVHGAYFGAWCWSEYWMPWFAAEGHPVFALSLRGHGRSSGRERLHDFGLAEYAEDLAAVLATLGRAPVLIGHSMGALVVQKVLERESVAPAKAAVLLCPVPSFGVLPASFALAFARPSLFASIQAMAAGQRLAPAALREALFAGAVDATLLERIAARVQPESRRALLDMSGWGLPQRWRMKMPPTLVVGTEHDALIPAAQARSSAQLLGAGFRLLPGLGHALMLEAGWRVAAEAVRDWLRETGS